MKMLSFYFKSKTREAKKLFPKRLFRYLVIYLVVVSVISWAWYFNQGLTLAYNDARSHLDVARRVVDNLQPGFAQIGSVWLPLYHVLELPLIWNSYLWHSGIAGSVISMASFVLGGIYLYKLTILLKFDWKGTVISVLIYSLNPNLIFMQTTPMTESLLIFLAIATVFYITRWVENSDMLDLMKAGFFTLLSTLTRYDGWFLLAFVFIVVFYITFKKRDYKFAEGNTILYGTIAGFGVILWFVWNLVIFGDPLYFALGPFSAKAQQDVILAEGRLYSKGNFFYSFFIYILVALYNSGLWVFIVSLVGVWYLVKSHRYSLNEKIALSLLLVPFVFNVFSLFAGHSVIHLPGLPPYTWFNNRYGLMLLPAVAVSVGYLVGKKKWRFILVSLIFFIQTTNMYLTNSIITIEDGVRGASGEYLDEAGNWISDNAMDGLILIAASSNDALIFKSGFPLKRFITEGAQLQWNVSLDDPTVYADWIVMHNGDLVEQNLRHNSNFLDNYSLVYKDNFSFIYKLQKDSGKSLSEDELPK